jgi:CheY-like chemotaxis protein/predicted transcriptional regulator
MGQLLNNDYWENPIVRKEDRLYSANVIVRILRILLESGSLRKTNLAGKAGINHAVLMKYLTFLKTLEWIDMTANSGGSESIFVTSAGTQVLTLLERTSYEGARTEGSSLLPNSYDVPTHAFRVQTEMNHDSKGQQSDIQRRNKLDFSRKGQGKNVMIVDDDETILMTYESFLVPNGYKVNTFSNAISALRHFTKNPSYYALAILDIRLPNMNGLQLYQSLKAINPSLQVIFVSSLDAAQELVTLIPGTSHSHIMRKPVNREHFVKVVRSIIPQ